MRNKLERLNQQPAWVMIVNFFMVMIIYMLSRWFFYYMNRGTFQDVTFSEMMTISWGGLRFDLCALWWGGLRFDLCALCYLNALCVLMQFVPLKLRHTVKYQRIVKILFLIFNALGIAVNAADIVYFEFGGRRTSFTIFSEFGGESNLGKIFLDSMTGHWQVWLFGIVMIVAMEALLFGALYNIFDNIGFNHCWHAWGIVVEDAPLAPRFGRALLQASTRGGDSS